MLDLVAYISQRRLDPVMTSIAVETRHLLDNLKTDYEESSDYLSSDEEEDGDQGSKEECLGGCGVDWDGGRLRNGYLEDEGGRKEQAVEQLKTIPFEKTNVYFNY